MDNDGFPLAAISEKSVTETDETPSKGKTSRSKRERNGTLENGDTSSGNRRRNKSKTKAETPPPRSPTESEPEPQIEAESSIVTSRISEKSNPVEVRSITDDDEEEPERVRRLDIQPRVSDNPTEPATMISSYTTGGEHEVIEIHQFSPADVDVYLDIYFETLNNRLRHYVGGGEQLNQFRNSMKNRIVTNTTSREYQNVLLGKMNGEVVAAVTMLFPNETPTVPLNYERVQEGSCLQSLPRWMFRKANYVPTNMEECYIEMIGVKSTFRNRGIGAAMLECVEHYAREVSATLLTIHTSGAQLQTYFERFGFNIDRSDSSALWKWLVERESITKLSKTVSSDPNGNLDYSMGSYLNESMAESLDE